MCLWCVRAGFQLWEQINLIVETLLIDRMPKATCHSVIIDSAGRAPVSVESEGAMKKESRQLVSPQNRSPASASLTSKE